MCYPEIKVQQPQTTIHFTDDYLNYFQLLPLLLLRSFLRLFHPLLPQLNLFNRQLLLFSLSYRHAKP